MKAITFIFIFMLIALGNASAQKKGNAVTDYVPDHETARKVAEAIWYPIFGKNIYWQKPFEVKLIGDSVWVVTGTLPKGRRGGVAYIEIVKSDCRIRKIAHGK
ncbi:YbbC/YhhH family protein [Chitinophaga sp. NPDC101104]|uniref:YbbC/YhhH family protein n=1 Tax=Chitinophaga sp. NPDC101104 TaxID=3390561 RepID=UPI003D091CB7